MSDRPTDGKPMAPYDRRRPVATLGRVEDGNRGNMGYWELACVRAVGYGHGALLRERAQVCGRELPDTRSEQFWS
jgi:hypothetical protein